MDLLKLFDKRLDTNLFKNNEMEAFVKKLIFFRKKEIGNFKKFYEKMTTIFKFSFKIQSNLEYNHFIQVYSKYSSLEKFEINDFCECVSFESIPKLDNSDTPLNLDYQIKIFEEISREQLDFFIEFINNYEKDFFLKFYLNKELEKTKSKLSLQDFFNNSVKNVQATYDDLVDQVINGVLGLEEFENLASLDFKFVKKKDISKSWQDNFKTLMKSRKNIEPSLIKARIEQLEIYLKIDKIKEITSILLEIKEKNSLTSDFSYLENTQTKWLDPTRFKKLIINNRNFILNKIN